MSRWAFSGASIATIGKRPSIFDISSNLSEFVKLTSMDIYQNLSDNELTTFLREGDAAAYTEIYDRYFQLMFIFAFKKLRDEELAKDFVQELFTDVWIKRDRILVDGNFVQYLYISLRSKMLNYFAHQKVETKYAEFLAHSFNSHASEQSDYAIREKQLSAYIDKQIENLPKRMRNVFELSRKDGMSNREIALVTSSTESNVSHHISNAVKILKSKIKIIVLLLG